MTGPARRGSARFKMPITVDGTVLFCRGQQVAARLREAGCKPIYNGRRGAWVVDSYRLADVLAYLESRRIGVVIHDESDDDGGDAA